MRATPGVPHHDPAFRPGRRGRRASVDDANAWSTNDTIGNFQEATIHDTGDALTPERAVLVGVIGPDGQGDGTLDELSELARTAGATVIDRFVQRRPSLDAGTFIGKGKLDEVKRAVEMGDADVVIIDDELTPAQTRNIEREVGVRVIDRSVLILDIFASHARTHEAKLQVELAQLQYLLPRLTRMWEHLGRTGGGIGTRGPGETQLEVDRRRIRTRISRLKEKIERVKVERAVQRRRRADSFRVALVGYTNAGKSTLFNALTRADVPVADQLFETLDTTTRRLHLRDGAIVLISDTVGFIRKLPHHLVASFRSTLDEVTEADLLLHVVDASSPNLADQIRAVDTVLDELDLAASRHHLVLNKMDLVTDEAEALGRRAQYPEAWMGSAHRAPDLSGLLDVLIRSWESWRDNGGRQQPRSTPARRSSPAA